jgi:phenylacetate-coenzyme A ligase PaaK-like adenylate-forming protein
MFALLRFMFRTGTLMSLARRSPEKIRTVQEKRWRRLLHYAAARSPFYKKRLAGLDLDHCQPDEVPTLTKSEMMANFDEIVTDRRIRRADVERFMSVPSNLGRYYLDRYAVCHTSGSQGQPALIVQEGGDILLGIQAQIARGRIVPNVPLPLHVVQRLFRPGRLAVVTQKPGFYPSGATFSYLAASSLRVIRLLHLSVFAPLEETVARLNDFQPEFITGYTSALEDLAREQERGNLHLRESGCLQGITSTSEPLPPDARALIESAFGVHVSDCYMLAECLALTSGCPHFNGAHINSDLALFEVVDDEYRPVPAGKPGTKVLVTNLYNLVQPVIRYEIGDMVTMSPSPCPCGSPFPLVQSVGGRTKERFWLETGTGKREIPYYLFLAALHHCTELAEHQVLQTGPRHFVVRVAPQPGQRVSAEQVRRYVRQSVESEGLAHLVEVDVEIVSHIPRDPRTGKVARARNLVTNPEPVESEIGSEHSENLQGV